MHRLGPYVLLTRIGVGGMAEIFLARREGGAVVALKRILPHLAAQPDFVSMFLDEARLASRLDHPSVARVFEVGKHGAAYYMALEYVPGEDLLTVIRRARERRLPTPVPEAVTILADAAAALHHAHECHDEHGRPLGIVHRDVTPSNLMVPYDGPVKLVDFGIAKAERRAQVTQAGALKGKYAYMAPEYALGGSVDRRADVFSLGVVAFELLTQRRLFHRETELAVLRAVTEERIPLPSERRSDLPAELDAIVMRALAREPADRWGTAHEIETALRQFAARQRAADVGAWMERLFGTKLAEQRRRWAAGDLEDEPKTEVSDFDTPAPTRTRSRVPDEDADLDLEPTPEMARPVALARLPEGTPPDRPRAPLIDVHETPEADGTAQAGEKTTPFLPTATAPPREPTPPARARTAARMSPARPAIPDDTALVTDAVPRLSTSHTWRNLVLVLTAAAVAAGVWWLVRGERDAADATPAARGLAPVGEPERTPPPSGAGLAEPVVPAPGDRQVASAVARPGGVAAAEGKIAWLSVWGPEGATLLLDGQPLGVLPLQRRKVPAGLHTLAVTVGDAPPLAIALDLAEGGERALEIVRDPKSGTVTHKERPTP